MIPKSTFFLVLLNATLNLSTIVTLSAQKSDQQIIDSLLTELPKAISDTNKVNLLNNISWSYRRIDPEKGVEYGEKAFALANQIDWAKGKAIAMKNVGSNSSGRGAYLEAIQQLHQAIDIAEEIQFTPVIALSSVILGFCYEETGQNESALKYYLISCEACRKIDVPYFSVALSNTGFMYNTLSMYPEALSVATELYEYGIEKNDEPSQANAFAIRADAYLALSNYPVALQNYFESIRIYEKYNYKNSMEIGYTRIGTIFQTQKDFDKALEFYNKSLDICIELGAKEKSALILSDIGSVYDQRKEYDIARSYYEQALEIYEGYENNKNRSMVIYNIGGIYLAEYDFANALIWLQRALIDARKRDDNFQAAATLGLLGQTYFQIGVTNDSTLLQKYFNGDKLVAFETGLSYTDSAITSLVDQGELKNRAFYLEQKSKIEADLNRYDEALNSFKQYVQIKDSLFNIERDKKLVQAELGYEFGRREDSLNLANTKQQLALQNELAIQAVTFEYDTKAAAAQSEREKQQLAYEEAIKREKIENEYAKKQAAAEALIQQRELERKQSELLNQAELKRQRNIRNSTLLGASGLLLFSIVVFRQRNKVKKEKGRSEALLLNILPAEIAEELKLKGKAEARDFDMVTILFTDFKAFTEMSAMLSATELVKEINECFEAFDGIMGKYSIEKIKTIGDSYMAAGGLPVPSADSLKNTVLAALEMQVFMNERKAKKDAEALPAFEMRSGIHTGPVVAGIVGVKKFQYDIWGDTVNTASRMESAGEVGKVNISKSTYELLKDDPDIAFESRGKVTAKGKGDMEMWFVRLKT